MRRRPVADNAALDEQLCFDLYAASRAVTRRYRPLLEELELTYPQYLAVLVLGSTGPASIKEVAGAMRLDHATLTPMLRRMERSQLIERRQDPDDRRSTLLELTEHGWEVHAATERVQCLLREELDLDDEQLRELQLTLRGVAAAMEAGLDAHVDA